MGWPVTEVDLDQQNTARHQRNPQMSRPNPGMWSLIKLQDLSPSSEDLNLVSICLSRKSGNYMWLCINDWVVHEWTQVHFDQFALHGAVQLTDVLTFVIISQCLLIMQNFDANLYFKNVYSCQFMIFHSVEGSAIEEIKQLWIWWWCHSVHLLTKSCRRGSQRFPSAGAADADC